MPMVTKLVRVMTYKKELPSMNLHDLSMEWSCELFFQKTHGHKNRQGVDLPLEAPTVKAT